MKSALTIFSSRCDELRAYIQGNQSLAELLGAALEGEVDSPIRIAAAELKQHFRLFPGRRVLDYNSIVISLYGAFEAYVEQLLVAYLDTLNRVIPRFSKLPDRVKDNHIELSAELMLRARLRKYQGIVDPEDMVRNLYSCAEDSASYKINAQAFTYHSVNLRHTVVNELFARVGINNICGQARRRASFSGFLSERNFGIDPSRLRDEKVFFGVNDLADRRNDVAHGTEAQLLSPPLLLERIDELSAFSQALFEVAEEQTLQFVVEYAAVRIGTPTAVFDSRIVCATLNNTRIRVGDRLIAVASGKTKRYVSGPILQIQVEGKSISEVDPESSIEVGMEVAFPAKSNHEFFVLGRKSAIS